MNTEERQREGAHCEYCLGATSLHELKRVELKFYDNGIIKWHRPEWVCRFCRHYLRGNFRYYRERENG